MSGALHFEIMKKLASSFCFVLIDLIGFGGSSRPDNYDKDKSTPQESLDYFLGYIEQWRVVMGNITGFYLSGHSFGAYIAGRYTIKYPSYIKKLLLISPIGV